MAFGTLKWCIWGSLWLLRRPSPHKKPTTWIYSHIPPQVAQIWLRLSVSVRGGISVRWQPSFTRKTRSHPSRRLARPPRSRKLNYLLQIVVYIEHGGGHAKITAMNNCECCQRALTPIDSHQGQYVYIVTTSDDAMTRQLWSQLEDVWVSWPFVLTCWREDVTLLVTESFFYNFVLYVYFKQCLKIL